MKSADVIVIGAGASGLVAANEIRHYDKTLRVLVLEASDRVGGKLEGVKFASGGASITVDLGGQLIEEGQRNVLQLIDQLGLSTRWVAARVPLQDIFWTGGSLKPWDRFELRRVVQKLDRLSKEIDPRHPYKNRRLAQELDSVTVKGYLHSLCYFSLSKDFLDLKIKTLFGQDGSNISMLYLMTYASSVGGFAKIFEPKNYLAVEGGARLICEKLVDRIGQENVLLNQPVCCVATGDDGKVLVTTRTQETFSCQRVICAISPNLTNQIEFQPPLNLALKYTVRNMSPGQISKFVLFYKRPFWREFGLSGKVFCMTEESIIPECEGPPFTMISDASTEIYVGKVEEEGIYPLVGLLTCYQSIPWSQVDPETLRRCILDSLSKLCGIWAHEAEHFEIKHWAQEAFSEGSQCTPRPGTMAFFYSLRQANGKVHFAGAETATRFIGHISGAIQSGQRAAIQVLDELRPQSLSAQDYTLLKEVYVSDEERLNFRVGKMSSPSSIYRWTFVFPVVGLAVGYAAYAFRDRYCGLFIPMHL